MKKAPLVAGFILASQSAFAQTAAPDLSKFISLPEGPRGQWIIHGKNKSEITVGCVRAPKTAEGKPGQPYFTFRSGDAKSVVIPGIVLEAPPEILNLPKSANLPARLTLSLGAEDYCNPNGAVKNGGGQKFVDDILTQTAQQLKVPKPALVGLLATLAR